MGNQQVLRPGIMLFEHFVNLKVAIKRNLIRDVKLILDKKAGRQ